MAVTVAGVTCGAPSKRQPPRRAQPCSCRARPQLKHRTCTLPSVIRRCTPKQGSCCQTTYIAGYIHDIPLHCAACCVLLPNLQRCTQHLQHSAVGSKLQSFLCAMLAGPTKAMFNCYTCSRSTTVLPGSVSVVRCRAWLHSLHHSLYRCKRWDKVQPERRRCCAARACRCGAARCTSCSAPTAAASPRCCVRSGGC